MLASQFLNLPFLIFVTKYIRPEALAPRVPSVVLASVLYTLTALSPTVSLSHKTGRHVIGSWCVGSLHAFIALLIFVYKGGGSFMVVGIIDSLDFPRVFQKASHLITYYDWKLLSQFKQ